MSGWTFDERFKAWAEREAVALITPNNTLAVATSKDMEAAFLGGVNSRDAEVQALREARKEPTMSEKQHRGGERALLAVLSDRTATARFAWVLVIITQMQLTSVYAAHGHWIPFSGSVVVGIIAVVQFASLNRADAAGGGEQ